MWSSTQAPAVVRNNRRYILAGGAVVAVLGTLAYRAYESDAYGRSKRYITKLRASLQKYSDALATGGDISASILRDLQEFLQSEGNEVPPTLRQVSKLLQSQEFTSTASSTVSAIYQGIAGPSAASGQQDDHQPRQQQQGTVDKILDALLSDRGHSLVSVAVSMAAKNMVSSYVETTARAAAANQGDDNTPQQDSTDKMFSFLSTPEGQQLAVMAVAAFASNGMRVYMDKSLEVNFYEDLFSSMAKPHHLEAVKQCVGVFARDVVASYLQGGYSGPPSVAGGPGDGRNDNVIEEVDGNQPQQQSEDARREAGHASAAVSLAAAESPTASSSGDGGTGSDGVASDRIEAVRGDGRLHTADDLDSDSILHSRRKKSIGKSGLGAQQQQEQQKASRVTSNTQWITAVGKEWLNVSKDPDGRQALAAVVGTATREMAAGVSTVMVERFNATYLMAVLVIGILSAMLFQQLIGAVFVR